MIFLYITSFLCCNYVPPACWSRLGGLCAKFIAPGCQVHNECLSHKRNNHKWVSFEKKLTFNYQVSVTIYNIKRTWYIRFKERDHFGPKLDDLPPVTPDEVKKLLSSIPGKSCPLDFIPTSLIKSCSNVFSDIISTLANLSFTEGRFPAAFKRAIVTPLMKKPDLNKSDPANYRPISNLNQYF